MDRANRSAEYRDILGIGKNQPPVDGPVSRSHTVSGDSFFFHAEIDGLALGQFVDFNKAAGVEKQVKPFACGQFAPLVMTIDGFLPTAGLRPTLQF
jgi:hypothetical protein